MCKSFFIEIASSSITQTPNLGFIDADCYRYRRTTIYCKCINFVDFLLSVYIFLTTFLINVILKYFIFICLFARLFSPSLLPNSTTPLPTTSPNIYNSSKPNTSSFHQLQLE